MMKMIKGAFLSSMFVIHAGLAGCASGSISSTGSGDLADNTNVQPGPSSSNSTPGPTTPAGLSSTSPQSNTSPTIPSGNTDPSTNPDTTPGPPFSFFVTSIEAMREQSGNQNGFGGNLGGLSGADSICQKIATKAGAGQKTWKAFLSAVKGPDGKPVNAIDRVGNGPWYDRLGRLVAQDRDGLLATRPKGDARILNDLPDENGMGIKQTGEHHDVLTSSNPKGQLINSSLASTCQDWTSAAGTGTEIMAGHAWARDPGQDGWIQEHSVGGCAPGVGNLLGNNSTDPPMNSVGEPDGYGAIFCFALTP